MLESVRRIVATATNVGADKTDPETLIGRANGAFWGNIIEIRSIGSRESSVGVAAYGTG